MNNSALAISSGVANLPSGTWAVNAFWYSELWVESEMLAMSVKPGATMSHVMLCLPISNASTCESWISPALDAACAPHRASIVARCGAGQDDAAALALFDEVLADRPAQQERAPELDVDLEIPLRIRHIDDLVVDPTPGDVDKNVQPIVGVPRLARPSCSPGRRSGGRSRCT
jgi:hypothetical protein